MKKNKGFTLIELMVVIAIIGTLAAIVTVSLSSARTSGSNAALKSNLSNAQGQLEVLAMQNGNYKNICTYTKSKFTSGDARLQKMLEQAYTNSAATSWTVGATAVAGLTNATCYIDNATNATKYAISMPLKGIENGKKYWCIDSSGFNGLNTTGITAASSYQCAND